MSRGEQEGGSDEEREEVEVKLERDVAEEREEGVEGNVTGTSLSFLLPSSLFPPQSGWWVREERLPLSRTAAHHHLLLHSSHSVSITRPRTERLPRSVRGDPRNSF